MKKIISALIVTATCAGCVNAVQHRQNVRDDSMNKLTVGTVQKEIRVGMSGAEVAQTLGSPNIVTTDGERREAWIYDRVATETAYSSSQGGVSSLILGGFSSVLLGGSAGGNTSARAGASSTTQRTLTVVIKFDAQKQVRDFAYHASQF